MANKYLISVDIEGVSGVVSTAFSRSTGTHYSVARQYMAHDANAVVQGILDADPEAVIVVRDAHGSAMNINLEALHPKAQLLQGWGAQGNMVASVDDSYRGVFLVGYHAGGQNSRAVLSHTFLTIYHSIRVNGQLINEAGISALYAGHFGVPVAFLSGDDHAVLEAKEQLGNIVTVMVKKSFARDSVCSLSLEETRKLLQKGAEQATQKLLKNEYLPLKMSCPLEVELQFFNRGYEVSAFQHVCDILSFDKTYRFDEKAYLLYYQAASPLEFFQRFNLIASIAYGVLSKG